MNRLGPLAVGLALSCAGDKDTTDDGIIPIDETDTDTDADADTDVDTDTDTDTDVEPAPLCEPLDLPDNLVVAGVQPLADVVATMPEGSILALQAGTWDLTAPVVIDKPLTIVGTGDDASAVVIDGGYTATNLLRITSPDVRLSNLTLSRSYDDAVVVEPGADRFTLHQVAVLDSGRYGVTAISDWDLGVYVDDGTVSCSTFDLSTTGRDEIRGLCETGGVDLYGVRGWTVRDNVMRGFWCDFGTSGPGIRATRGSRDVLITRNQLLDAAFGIVLGETQDQIGRRYDDQPCGTDLILQAVDGVVTNNIVAAYEDDLLASDDGVLTGIRIEASCNATVAHNSIFAGATPTSSSLEQRYATTSGLVANNLLSDKLVRADDAAAEAMGNIEVVQFDTWFFPAAMDFHTSPGATWAIDAGDPVTIGIVTEDVDGEPRDDGFPDVGADEQ